MAGTLFQNLAIAVKAAIEAFNRASKGETLAEILGYTDGLTGIPNRKAFEEDRHHVDLFDTFVLIDVDNLKDFNDTFGQLFGDRILRKCANILNKATENSGKAYRLSGDEFALVVPQCRVKNVCLYIQNRIDADDRFSVSMGIAPPCGPDGLTEELFKTAENALFQCRHRETNIYAEYLTDENENRENSEEITTIPAGAAPCIVAAI